MLKSTVYRCQTQTPISNFHFSIPKVEMLQTHQQIEDLILQGNFSLFNKYFLNAQSDVTKYVQCKLFFTNYS